MKHTGVTRATWAGGREAGVMDCVMETEARVFKAPGSGAGIMEADDRQVTTVFTVQRHRYSTSRVSWSVTIVGEGRGEV